MLVSLSNKSASQIIRHVNRRGVERKISMRLAAAFDPINMVARLLAQKFRDFDFQLTQLSIAFDEFLSDFFVLAQFYKFAYRFAQSLDWQSHIIFHQFRATNSQFSPCAFASAAVAAEFGFRRRLNFFTRNFDVFKKFIRLAQNIRDEFHRISFAQRGEQTFFRARIP